MTSKPPSVPSGGDAYTVRFQRAGRLVEYISGVKQFSRNVRLFLLVTAFRGMVIATLQTVLNLYLYSLGYDARFIGIINGANAVASLSMSIVFGYLADRFGRRLVLVLGGVAYPLAILGLSLSTSTPAILLFNFLFGGVAAAYWVAGIPLLVASTTDRQRVQAFSVNSFLLWGLGPLGALLSGQIVEEAARIMGVSASSSSALRFGMFFMAGLAFLGAVPYAFLREPPRAGPGAGAQPPRGGVSRLFALLLLPDVLLTLGGGAILTFIQLYFHLRFGASPGTVGIIVAVGGVVSGVGTLSVPLLAQRWGNLRTAIRLLWATVPFMVVLAVTSQIVLAVPAYLLVLALRSMEDPVYTAFIQERVPEAYRARLTGLYSVTYSVGYALGPAFSGQIQKAGGFTPAFLLGTGLYFLGPTLLYLFFGRRTSRASLLASEG